MPGPGPADDDLYAGTRSGDGGDHAALLVAKGGAWRHRLTEGRRGDGAGHVWPPERTLQEASFDLEELVRRPAAVPVGAGRQGHHLGVARQAVRARPEGGDRGAVAVGACEALEHGPAVEGRGVGREAVRRQHQFVQHPLVGGRCAHVAGEALDKTAGEAEGLCSVLPFTPQVAEGGDGALRATGGERSHLGRLLGAVARGPEGGLDRGSPSREGGQRLFGHALYLGSPFAYRAEGEAEAGELVAKSRLVEVAEGLCPVVDRGGMERAPAALPVGADVRDDDVGMDLGVAGTRGPVRERGAQEALGLYDLPAAGASAEAEALGL